MMEKYRELRADEVSISFTPEDIAALGDGNGEDEIIGQPRAIKALRLGTEIKAKGYNIFVTGQPGTGRKSAILSMLKNRRPNSESLKDIAFVHNFRRPEAPRVLYFLQGTASVFSMT